MVKKELGKRNRSMTKSEIKDYNAKIKSAGEDSAYREFLNRQKELKEAVLAKMYKGAELREIRKQIDNNDIKVLWKGMQCPKEILVVEHDMIQHDYFEIASRQKYLEQNLKGYGLKKKEFDDIMIRNKFVKELPKKSKSKADYIG